MKKIFILTGEPSGDKLASRVISKLQILNPNIEYLSVGGENLSSLGIKSIYNLKDITLEASLSPEGSPVNIKIFFILLR